MRAADASSMDARRGIRSRQRCAQWTKRIRFIGKCRMEQRFGGLYLAINHDRRSATLQIQVLSLMLMGAK
jgi:hypothetical protein